MEKQQKLILMSAFVMGLLTGVYFYLTGFAPTYSKLEHELASDEPEFTVVGERYGGCAMAGQCAIFRLDDERNYRYGPYMPRGEERTFQEGKLSRPTFRQLIDALDDADLALLSRTVEPEECPSMVDGIDTLYTITIGDDEYPLDTCGSRFSRESELGRALESVWNELE